MPKTVPKTVNRIVITPPGRFSLPKVADLWEAREVLYRFGARDVTLRYRQTALGVVWVVLQPLLTALIFVLVFGKVAHLSFGGEPPMVFIFVGLLAWNLFSGIIPRAQGSLVANRDLVSKVFFPRMLVPLAVVYSCLIDFLVSAAFLVVLLVVYGVNPGFAAVMVPVWTLMVILLASGIGLVTSALTVRYRDVNYFVPFILQFLLYASPIAYSIANVPAKYRFIYDMNPLTWLLQEFQWSLVRQPLPHLWEIAASIIVPVAVFVGGAIIFEQMERGFADVI
jgi:lipopolysaccharide transport system permease protein